MSLFGKLKHEAVKLKREAKKVAEVETPIERKLREATSNENWGCPNSVLYEITQMANDFHDRRKIMKTFEEKLSSEPHRWRRILKTLTLLEFLIKNCSEDILPEMLSEQIRVRRLVNFQYTDEGKERGGIVRDKASAIIDLVSNQSILKEGRDEAKAHRAKMVDGVRDNIGGGASSSRRSPEERPATDLSRSAMEQRFSDLKKKRNDEREREERERVEQRFSDHRDGRDRSDRHERDEDRNRRERDSPRDENRDGYENYEVHIPPPDDSRRKAPAHAMDIMSGLDSDDNDNEVVVDKKLTPNYEASPSKVDPPMLDLLDFGDSTGDATAGANAEDWADFAAAPKAADSADLLGAVEETAQKAPVVTDMFDVDFQSAGQAATGMFDMDFQSAGQGTMQNQAPIFTGPSYSGSSLVQAPPPSGGYFTSAPTPSQNSSLFDMSSGATAPVQNGSPFDMPCSAPVPAQNVSPFDMPWAQPAEAPVPAVSADPFATATPADAPKTFLDDMPAELLDFDFSGAAPSRR